MYMCMTIPLDLETWFKVFGHHLLKCTMCAKYEPDSTKEKECMLRTRCLGQTDGLITISRLIEVDV